MPTRGTPTPSAPGETACTEESQFQICTWGLDPECKDGLDGHRVGSGASASIATPWKSSVLVLRKRRLLMVMQDIFEGVSTTKLPELSCEATGSGLLIRGTEWD